MLPSRRLMRPSRFCQLGVALAVVLLPFAMACGQVDGGAAPTDRVALQTIVQVCIQPMIDKDKYYDAIDAAQETIVGSRDGIYHTLRPEIESAGGATFYIKPGVPQSRIDEIAEAMRLSSPEVERVVQVKIRPNIDSGPPQDVCEDPSKK